MNLLIFQNLYEFFQFFLRLKFRFLKKIKAITAQLLVQSLGKGGRGGSKIWNDGI